MNDDAIGSGGMLPTLGKDATLEELQAAYREVEASDAPAYLKQQVLMELADRIRDFGTAKKPEPLDSGESFAGSPTEHVAKSGFRGKLPDGEGHMTKVRP